MVVMLIRRANKYCSEPTPYQAQAIGQWVGATRFVFNIGLKQRIDAWRKGVRLDHNDQAKELTAAVRWRTGLSSLPVTLGNTKHSLNALRPTCAVRAASGRPSANSGRTMAAPGQPGCSKISSGQLISPPALRGQALPPVGPAPLGRRLHQTDTEGG
jgi:hypothetical protein